MTPRRPLVTRLALCSLGVLLVACTSPAATDDGTCGWFRPEPGEIAMLGGRVSRITPRAFVGPRGVSYFLAGRALSEQANKVWRVDSRDGTSVDSYAEITELAGETVIAPAAFGGAEHVYYRESESQIGVMVSQDGAHWVDHGVVYDAIGDVLEPRSGWVAEMVASSTGDGVDLYLSIDRWLSGGTSDWSVWRVRSPDGLSFGPAEPVVSRPCEDGGSRLLLQGQVHTCPTCAVVLLIEDLGCALESTSALMAAVAESGSTDFVSHVLDGAPAGPSLGFHNGDTYLLDLSEAGGTVEWIPVEVPGLGAACGGAGRSSVESPVIPRQEANEAAVEQDPALA